MSLPNTSFVGASVRLMKNATYFTMFVRQMVEELDDVVLVKASWMLAAVERLKLVVVALVEVWATVLEEVTPAGGTKVIQVVDEDTSTLMSTAY